MIQDSNLTEKAQADIDKMHYEDHKIMYKAIADRTLTSIRQGFMVILPLLFGALAYLWNKNTELEHRLTTLEVTGNKHESVITEHIADPKLHHNIIEKYYELLAEVEVLKNQIYKMKNE